MKSSIKKIVPLLVFVFVLSLFTSFTWAKEKKKDIYDPALDVKAAIKAAMVQGKKENKHILLMFGGNWCPWCHRLHELMNADAAIKKFLADNYILIMVDVGEKPNEPLNRDLVKLYRVNGMGYPSLAVLGYTKGELLCSQNSGILEKGKAHDPKRVMGFLVAEAPPKK
jgi:thioredoxin-related protein